MEDIEICENIFVPDIFILKLKTVCTKPREEVNDHNEILQELKYKHQDFEFSRYNLYPKAYFIVSICNKLKCTYITTIFAIKQEHVTKI